MSDARAMYLFILYYTILYLYAILFKINSR